MLSGEQEKIELDELIAEKEDKLSAVFNSLFPWSFFYELPAPYLPALFLLSVTSKEQIEGFKSSVDPNQSVIDWARSDIEPEGWLNLDDQEDLSFLISLTMALNFNIAASKMGKTWLNKLITLVRTGDREALFDAVLIDRMVLSCPSVSKTYLGIMACSIWDPAEHTARVGRLGVY